MAMPLISRIQTVTEITRSIKALLENGFAFVAVCGEVSNLKAPYSGHLYFTLKDREAQIRAVLFKTQRRYLPAEIADGSQVICRGRVSLYEPRGEYQLIVDSVEFAGAGDRQAAFEQLKEKLSQEGLFSAEHKKKLPLLPKGIAVITSPRGAAIHDFLTIAARRFPSIPIEIHPVSVQGESAAAEIISAITAACQRGRADVIVICRGGGSVEDLWSFNSEALARAVFAAPLPIVSAIGHEVDFTILDFVADYRAPTPTAAAEAVLPEQVQLQLLVRRHTLRLRQIMTQKVEHYQRRLSLQHRLLGNPTKAIDTFRMRIDFLLSRLRRSIDSQLALKQQQLNGQRSIIALHNPQQILTRHQHALANLRQRLIDLSQRHLERKSATLQRYTALIRSVSPLTVLERGYAIVQRLPDKKIIRSKNEVSCGERLEIRLHEGSVTCEVTEDESR
jgi:exodeoxyribonuclease VII large subunit